MINVIRRSPFYQRLTATQTEEPENITNLINAVRAAIRDYHATQKHPATPNRALSEALDSLYHGEQPVEEVIELIRVRRDEMRGRLLKLEQDRGLSKDSLSALEKQEAEQIEAYQIAVIQDNEEAAALWSKVTETQRQADAVMVKLKAFEVGVAELKEAISTYTEAYKALFFRSRMDHLKKYHNNFIRTAGADFIEALTLYHKEIYNLGIGYRPSNKTLLSDEAIEYMKERLSLTFSTEESH